MLQCLSSFASKCCQEKTQKECRAASTSCKLSLAVHYNLIVGQQQQDHVTSCSVSFLHAEQVERPLEPLATAAVALTEAVAHLDVSIVAALTEPSQTLG